MKSSPEDIFVSPEVRSYVLSDGKGGEFMRISKDDGIVLNRAMFPNWDPGDFVKAFINIIENNFDVKFVPRESNDEKDKQSA